VYTFKLKCCLLPFYRIWSSYEGRLDVCSSVCVCVCFRSQPCVLGCLMRLWRLQLVWAQPRARCGEGWRRMGFEFHLVDYFYQHYFNNVHIKMMIKASCGGWGLKEGKSLQDIISCQHQHTNYRTFVHFKTPTVMTLYHSNPLWNCLWVIDQVTRLLTKREAC